MVLLFVEAGYVSPFRSKAVTSHRTPKGAARMALSGWMFEARKFGSGSPQPPGGGLSSRPSIRAKSSLEACPGSGHSRVPWRGLFGLRHAQQRTDGCVVAARAMATSPIAATLKRHQWVSCSRSISRADATIAVSSAACVSQDDEDWIGWLPGFELRRRMVFQTVQAGIENPARSRRGTFVRSSASGGFLSVVVR